MSPVPWGGEGGEGPGAGGRLEEADLPPLADEGQRVQLVLRENGLQS